MSELPPQGSADEVERLIRAIPKTETHLHIEGALSLDLLREWKPEEYEQVPHFRAPDFQFASFSEFDSALLSHAVPYLDSAERYHETAKALFGTHVAANVRYVELSFHLPIAGFLGIPATEIRDAIRAAVPAGLEVRIFAGMLRTDYAGDMAATIDGLAQWDDLAGVDLHGDEAVPNQPWTAEVWGRLRSAGKVTKAHAGEFDGAARVREAIEVLGVTRVQHGVRAAEDPEVIALAVERGVIFDMCPISNKRLGVTPDLANHPLPDLLDAGLRCTVSTDDPFLFPGDMNDVYRCLARDLGMGIDGLRAVAAHGFETALASHEQKARWMAELDAAI